MIMRRTSPLKLTGALIARCTSCVLLWIGIILSVALTLSGQTASASQFYTVTRIGFGGYRDLAFDINDHGQLVGEAYIPGVGTRAFVYDHSGVRSLGTLGGYESYARAIPPFLNSCLKSGFELHYMV
jgi:probable HAF family extracellular repeat protein